MRSPVGIDDLKEYETEKASFDELSEQHSYFDDLLKGLKNKEKIMFNKRKTSNKSTKKAKTGIPVTIKTHKDKNGGHPHIIVDNIDDKHVSVGLSTSKTKGKGSKNYRMEKSPLNDGKESYMRRQGTVAPKSEYYGTRKGSMTPKDFNQAQKYGSKAKEKYLEKKTKKNNGSANETNS